MSQITIGGTTLNFKDSAFTGDQWEQVASWVLNGGAEGIDANAQIATEKAAAASASAAAARNSATSAGESATAAAYWAEQAQQAVGGVVSMVRAEIPKGRMRGDVDGDGKITQDDATQTLNHATGIITLTGADLWCADVNADGKNKLIDSTIINQYLSGAPTVLTSAPTFADYYNNWTYHKVDDTSGYWTTELSIPAITENTDGSIIWSGTGFPGTFIKAETFSGGVRIYANYPPIEALPCAVIYHTGSGGQFIISNTGVSETGAKYAVVDLTASGWSEEKKQTISVPGLKRDVLKQLIIPTQLSEDIEKYYSAGIRISARGDNTLTFSCDTIPTENIKVVLVIIPIIGKFEG